MDKQTLSRVCYYIVNCGALCRRQVVEIAGAVGYVRDTDKDEDLRYRRQISEKLIDEQNKRGKENE